MALLHFHFQRMRKIKPFKLADVTRILNVEERSQMIASAFQRILDAESKSSVVSCEFYACMYHTWYSWGFSESSLTLTRFAQLPQFLESP